MNREWTIVNALRVAANVYRDDAAHAMTTSPATAAQFRKQETEARQLADMIENVGLNPFGERAS